MTNTYPLKRRSRLGLLILLAAAVVGIACVTIPIPPPAETTAADVYLTAAKNGDVVRQYQLSMAYRFGTVGLKQSNSEALAWLQKSANGGHVPAQLTLGDAYIYGELGLEKNALSGMAWLRKAADAGSTDAQFHIAALLESGHDVEADPPAAAQWYEKAARGGKRFAAWRLARLYEQGKGVARNPVDAAAWYRIGDGEVDALRIENTLGPRDRILAAALYKALSSEIAK